MGSPIRIMNDGMGMSSGRFRGDRKIVSANWLLYSGTEVKEMGDISGETLSIIIAILVAFGGSTALTLTLFSRLDRRFDAVERRIEGVERSVESRFDGVESRFDAIESRFDAVDRRFDAVDRRFDAVERRIESVERSVESRFDAVDRRFEAVERRFERVGNDINILINDVGEIKGILGISRASREREPSGTTG